MNNALEIMNVLDDNYIDNSGLISISSGGNAREKIFNDGPDSLIYLSLNSFVKYFVGTSSILEVQLKNGLVLPSTICNALFALYTLNREASHDKLLKLFENPCAARLTQIYLNRCTTLAGKNWFEVLISMHIRKLELTDVCFNYKEQNNLLFHLNKNAQNIEMLLLEGVSSREIFSSALGKNDNGTLAFEEWPYILKGPNLKFLGINCSGLPADFLQKLIIPLKRLSHLDLSFSNSQDSYKYLKQLPHLISLTLYGTFLSDDAWKSIKALENLQHLNVSVPRSCEYDKPDLILESLIESLPNLKYLDISGTNLDQNEEGESSILALRSRVNHPLEFLGLYGTYSGSHQRSGIPAKRISGSNNWLQLINALLTNVNREEVLIKILRDLESINIESNHIYTTLELVFKIMDRHLSHKYIQFNGMKLVNKLLEKKSLLPPVKSRIINRVLNIYSLMKRNYTICKVVCQILLRYLQSADKVDFESLSEFAKCSMLCFAETGLPVISDFLTHFLKIIDSNQNQKDLFVKELFSQGLLCYLYASNVKVHVFFWDFLFLLLDKNRFYQTFFYYKGTDLLQCITKDDFEDKIYLSILKILCNIPDFASFRVYLETRKCLNPLKKLLHHKYGFAVRFYAGYILIQLLAFGAEAWTVKKPSRESVLTMLDLLFENWMCVKECFVIDDKLFESILSFLKIQHTWECQYLAMWGIYIFIKQNRKNYCSLIEKYGGVNLMRNVVTDGSSHYRLKEIASMVNVEMAFTL